MSSQLSKTQWRFRVNAKFRRGIPPDRDAGRLAAMFGLGDGLAGTLYDGFEFSISPGRIVAVIGPSGAGKSVLLARLAGQVKDALTVRPESLGRSDRPAVALLAGGTLAERLEVLSRCGLAEAAVLVTAARSLSGGQLFRLALAAALHEARRRAGPTLVIADEFASSLDELTATMLCRQVRKLISASRVAAVLATPRAELLESLRPDLTIVKPLAGPAVATRRLPTVPRRRVLDWRARIVRGSIADYDELSRFHYLAGRPATHKRVYVIRAANRRAFGGPKTAAVLVVSPPLANVRGRNLATGGRYCSADRSAAMGLLNREVECVSRVVVHPIFRGCGLAVRLVRRAIASRQTAMIEALAAMGAVHPFFARAGMTAYPLGPDRHVARLVSAAEAVGLDPADLPAVEPVRRLLARRRSAAAKFLRREIDIATRGMFQPIQLARLADPLAETCRRTARQYVYYLADK